MANLKKHKVKKRKDQKRKESRMKQQAGKRKKPLNRGKVIKTGEVADLPSGDKDQAEMMAKWRAEQAKEAGK